LWHKYCFKNKVTFVSDLKAETMKKIGLIVVFAFLAAIALSSCNKQACPAYSSNNTDNTEQAG
jgi:3-methyladenine DNA glycosylase Tag